MPRDRPLDILILGLNYAPEAIGTAVYTAGLAEALVERGHRVRVVAGKPYYPGWHVPEAFRGGWRRTGTENGVEVTRIAHYVPAHPSSARRILHHASFALSALPAVLGAAFARRPDVVVAIVPSLMGAPVARLAALLRGARSWIHIQDFEVEAAAATGLLKDGPTLGFALRIEAAVLKMFDRVSSISPAMCGKCRQKGIAPERVIEFRNWADLEAVGLLDRPSAFRAQWDIAAPYVALYSGNIANKQGIEIVVEAARALRHRSDLVFVICGEGPNRVRLEDEARGLGNVLFRDLQPRDALGELMGLATLHLLPQKASAADLVLPSKLTNMLASGRPVVATAHPGTGLAAEVDGCGLVVPPGDVAAFSAAITRLLDDPAERTTLGLAARRRAETRWARGPLIDGFAATLTDLVQEDTAREDAEAPRYQDLSRFSVPPGFRGRSGVTVLLWQVVQATLFGLSPQPCYGWRRWLLRRFGAQVGKGALVRPTARMTYPWKVTLGDHCWIGDRAELYSLGPISIGAHAVVSQHSYLCAGTHDPTHIAFPLVTKPITVEREAWIAAGCFIAPGVTIGRAAIIAARSTVLADVPPAVLAAGAPATVRRPRPLPSEGAGRGLTP